MRRRQLWVFASCARRQSRRSKRADPKSISASAWDWRLHELKKVNLPVKKDRKGDTAPVGEVGKISSFDIGAEIHGGGAPGRKMSARAAAAGKSGYVGARKGRR